MLTYGLQRHRPLLLVAGFAAFASAMARLVFYFNCNDDPPSIYSYSIWRIEGLFRVGLGVGTVGYALLLTGLILLITVASAARIVLILSSIVWIPATALMVVGHSKSYGPEPSARIGSIAYFVLDTSMFPVLVLSLLLFAGVGSARRPRADPHDEHLLRERAAGGFSGFAFIISIGTAICWALHHSAYPVSFARLLTPSDLLEWMTLAGIALTLVAVVTGIVGWVLMLARHRLGGFALMGFSIIFLLHYLAGAVHVWAIERKYGSTFFLERNWPPLGVAAAAADSIEVVGIMTLGIVWGWRYFRAPPRVEAGSAFQPLMRRTPPPLPPVDAPIQP